MRDHVGQITRHVNFVFSRYSGASPQIGETLPLDFFDGSVLSCPYLFFLDPASRSNRWTDFHALCLKQRVFEQGWSFWGYSDG